MTVATPPILRIADSRLASFWRDSFDGSRILYINAIAMFVAFAVCVMLQSVDGREFNGISVWVKPGKFFFSMAVHFVTVAWAFSLLDAQQRATRAMTWLVGVLLFCAWTELAYIAFRAAFGEASHFNVGTPISAILYSVMAIFAMALVIVPAVIGVKIWRKKRDDVWAQSVALGFGLAAVLSIIIGMTLGGQGSHWIGGDLTDATGLPVFKWSTTGGDLRVSHFIGLHAMQVVPFAAISGKRNVVWSTAGAVTLLSVLAFIQALNGVPLLRG